MAKKEISEIEILENQIKKEHKDEDKRVSNFESEYIKKREKMEKIKKQKDPKLVSQNKILEPVENK